MGLPQNQSTSSKKTGADAIVIGEGEKTIVDLMEAIGNHTSLKSIKGIAYHDGDNTVINKRRPLIENIDMIPFPYLCF